MGCGQSKASAAPAPAAAAVEPAPTLTLPQQMPSDADRQARKDRVEKRAEGYQFAVDRGMPPHPVLNALSMPHEFAAEEKFGKGMLMKLAEFSKITFLNIFEQTEVVGKEIAAEASSAAASVKDRWRRLGAAGEALPKSHEHGDKYASQDLLFKTYSVMFKQPFLDTQLPFGGKLTDEAFGVRAKTASAPYQIKRVDAIPPHVKISEDDVRGVLPDGDTLASLIADKRLYMLDYSYVAPVKIWEKDQFKNDVHWVVTPTCFMYLTKDRVSLLPCAVQLYPDPHPTPNLVFTPKDAPGLWLAAKMFVINASNNVHVCETHFMAGMAMVGMGMSMRRCLDVNHPVQAFMEPYMYMFLGMWAANRPSDSDFKTPVIRELWSQWDWQKVVTPNQFKNQGIDDRNALPHFYWRDDVQNMWSTFHELVTGMMENIYKTEQDMAQDTEIQAFARELVDPKLCGYKGFKFAGTAESPMTREHLIELLTQCITMWTCRYPYDTFSWPWYVWIPFTPISFALPPPTTRDDISLEAIRDAMLKPGSFNAGLQRTAIKIVYEAPVSVLTNGDKTNPRHVPEVEGYLEKLPGAQPIVKRYFDALNALEDSIKARDEQVRKQPHNNIVYGMRPTLVQGSQACI